MELVGDTLVDQLGLGGKGVVTRRTTIHDIALGVDDGDLIHRLHRLTRVEYQVRPHLIQFVLVLIVVDLGGKYLLDVGLVDERVDQPVHKGGIDAAHEESLIGVAVEDRLIDPARGSHLAHRALPETV